MPPPQKQNKTNKNNQTKQTNKNNNNSKNQTANNITTKENKTKNEAQHNNNKKLNPEGLACIQTFTDFFQSWCELGVNDPDLHSKPQLYEKAKTSACFFLQISL